MTGPELSDADLWEKFHEAGLSPDAAKMHVERRRQFSPEANQTALDKEEAAIAPNAVSSAIEGFGQGASLGLVGDKDVLRLARKAHPIATGAGDVAGAAALSGIAAPAVAGLSPGAAGAVLGGTYGAGRGAVEGGEGHRMSGALIGGGLGAAGGYGAARLGSAVAPTGRTIGRNVGRLLKGGSSRIRDALASAPQAAPAAALDPEELVGGVARKTLATMKGRPGMGMKAFADRLTQAAKPHAGAEQLGEQAAKATASATVGQAEDAVPVKTPMQRGATKSQLANRSGSMADRARGRVHAMTDEELQQAVAQVARRKDAAAPLYAGVLEEELASRLGP